MNDRYRGPHRSIRRAGLPFAYGTPCVRCGRPMLRGQQLDLDHADDRAGYMGFAHAVCNRRAGGRLGNARRRARREGLKRMLTKCVLAVEVSEDRLHTSIAAAGEYRGMMLVELAAYLDGVFGVVAAVQELRASRRVGAVAIDPHSHAANLVRVLREAHIRVTELSSLDVAAAHGQFLDELAAGRLRHVGDPRLDAAVRAATQRPLGGGDTWLRRGVPVDVSPLTAATLALWLAQERQRKPKIS